MTTLQQSELARLRANQSGDLRDLRDAHEELGLLSGEVPGMARWYTEQRIPFLEWAIETRARQIRLLEVAVGQSGRHARVVKR